MTERLVVTSLARFTALQAALARLDAAIFFQGKIHAERDRCEDQAYLQ